MARTRTRKQWRKKQQEKRRRRRLETRRQRQQQKRNMESKKRENIMSQALGITAMQGYRNILSPTLALSKSMRSDYLIGMAREKRFQNSLSRYLEDYNQERHTSPLHYAVSKVDPTAVRLLLEMGKNIQLNKKDIFGHTALEDALVRLRETVEQRIRGDTYGQSQFHDELKKKQEKQNKLIDICSLLIEAGTVIGTEELTAFWETGPFIQVFLKGYPEIVSESYKHKNMIFGNISYDLEEVVEEIKNEESRDFDGYGEYSAYSTVPQHLYDQLEAREYALETFKQFWNTYNPETGTYNLSDSPNENE